MKLSAPNISQYLADCKNNEDFFRTVRRAEEKDAAIKAVHFKDIFAESEDICYGSFEGCVFENCRFIGCDFENTSFTDVRFIRCDFSNSRMDSAYFNRCEITSSKLVGTNFNRATLKNLRVKASSLMYGVISDSSFSQAVFDECDFTCAEIVKSSLRAFEVRNCRFVETSFFTTPLAGIDFSDSILTGIRVSENFRELKNAAVSPAQAAELATLLGVIIK